MSATCPGCRWSTKVYTGESAAALLGSRLRAHLSHCQTGRRLLALDLCLLRQHVTSAA